jgi:hypothetical protein
MSNSWWANKLGTQAPTQGSSPLVMPPSAAAMTPYQPPRLPQTTAPASAMAARCPNCSSGNYGGNTMESRPRCYDCGYPLQQSGSGVPGARIPTEGPVQATKQVGTGGFNPGQIVDRIG